MMSWHRVQAYTEYSIHRVQHTPSTAYTEYSIPRTVSLTLHSHDHELTPECSFSFQSASLYYPLPSASSPLELKGKVTMSHSHSCESTDWWIESQHPACSLMIACNYSADFAWTLPPTCFSQLACSQPHSSHEHGHQVQYETRSIIACKCISKYALLPPPTGFINSLDHDFGVHLFVHLITAPKCISKYTTLLDASASPDSKQLQAPSAYPNWLEYGLHFYLYIRSISTCKCISKLPGSRPRSVSPITFHYRLQVHPRTRTIMAL